jgi:hypothetical protein
MFGIALCQNKRHIETFFFFFFVLLLWMKENKKEKGYTLTPSRYDKITLYTRFSINDTLPPK